MSKIKRYKLKEGHTPQAGYWSHTLIDEISIEPDTRYAGGPKNWNDIDALIVLDEDFGQPYTPFYDAYDSDYRFPFLDEVISAYNSFMDSLDWVEEIKMGGLE